MLLGNHAACVWRCVFGDEHQFFSDVNWEAGRRSSAFMWTCGVDTHDSLQRFRLLDIFQKGIAFFYSKLCLDDNCTIQVYAIHSYSRAVNFKRLDNLDISADFVAS